ncbi:hypothetical protein ASU35_15710 [Acetivibrio ethanolgignens]|uniref:Uncharacterized protein n=1 Tax=Acetivibrio ethanolgignens TaxID=290052 RepID=A0A0V8QAT6_9FIRM|nr:hypothetical protein ASU35_15710 [Acetivibrio ethanolgignens]
MTRLNRRMRNQCRRRCLKQFNIEDRGRSGLWLGRYFFVALILFFGYNLMGFLLKRRKLG